MAYQINKTDGTVVATVADGQVDSLSTDLTLIGKNYSGFGEALNENFIKLLENFASTTRPTRPIRGQIWFDSSELKLKVYSGTQFLPVSSATIANIQPSTLGVGDLWFNDVDAQLYFYDGTSPILLGPSYSTSQGVSGVKVASILDTLNQTRVITYLYNNGILLGIFAKDSFTPKNAIIGFTGNITPGFNAGNLSGLKFNVTCTNSDSLGGVVSSTYVRKDTSNTISGQVNITTDLGIVIGSAGQANLKVNSGNVALSNASSNNDLILNVRKGIDQEDAVRIYSGTRTVDFYAGFNDSQVNMGGSLTVEGNLTVQGTTTTINTSTLTIEDKNIVLANVGSPTNTTADGAGITIRSDGTGGNKTLTWTAASTAWNSSEHINIASGKEYKINGVTVLNSTTAFITNFPFVNQLGTQISVQVGPYSDPGNPLTADPQLLLEEHRISTIQSNYDIELYPDGTGNIKLNGTAKIIDVADPTDPQDAATKEYVDDTIETRAIVLSMDLSDGKPNAWIVTNILNNIAPVSEYRLGTIARILCTSLNNSTTSLDIDPLVSESKSPFLTDVYGSTAPAVYNVSVGVATVAAPSTVVPTVITFELPLALNVTLVGLATTLVLPLVIDVPAAPAVVQLRPPLPSVVNT
jgi:hypothetical protein